MASFRLWHASDLHLARKPSQVDPKYLLPALFTNRPKTWIPAWASSFQPHVAIDAARTILSFPRDAVVVSGDVATTGQLADQLAALIFLRGSAATGSAPWLAVSYGRLWPTIHAARSVVAIPGNHDRYTMAPVPYSPGDQTCNTTLSWPKGRRAKKLVSLRKAGETLHLLGVDCSLASGDSGGRPFGALARGRVTKTGLVELAALTARYAQNGAVAWVVHWPPEASAPASLHALVDESKLVDLAARLDVCLIMSGHTHTADVYRTINGVPVACCGSTSQYVADEPNSMLDVTLEVSGQVCRSVSATYWEYTGRGSAAFQPKRTSPSRW